MNNEALERARVIHERLKVAENLPAGGKTSPGVTLLLVTSILACEEYEQAIKDERARVEEMVDEIRGWEDTLVMGSYEESVRSVRSEMKEFLRAIKGGE